jgi:hypothetical protein
MLSQCGVRMTKWILYGLAAMNLLNGMFNFGLWLNGVPIWSAPFWAVFGPIALAIWIATSTDD